MDLKHIPLMKVDNYGKVDGKYSAKSDAVGLSVGIAQWNRTGGTDISAKVWRHTEHKAKEGKKGKWSRQSEELPTHRVLDLATLVCIAMKYSKDGKDPRGTENFSVSTANDQERLSIMTEQFTANEQHLKVSLKRLVDALDDLGYTLTNKS